MFRGRGENKWNFYFPEKKKSVPNVLTRLVISQKMAVNFTALIQVRVTIVGGRIRSLIEGDIGIFGFTVLAIFLDRFFGFCAKRLRFLGFGVRCGLRIFRFLASGFRLSVVVNNSGSSVLLFNAVFGFSYFESK